MEDRCPVCAKMTRVLRPSSAWMIGLRIAVITRFCQDCREGLSANRYNRTLLERIAKAPDSDDFRLARLLYEDMFTDVVRRRAHRGRL